MQTFMPYADFTTVALSLDTKRLGKQRVENLQIMKALSGESAGWQNHPAVKMWRNYEWALMEYQKAVCRVWTQLYGYNDTCLQKTLDVYMSIPHDWNWGIIPSWVYDSRVHVSHRSNLLRKSPDHYGNLWNDVASDIEYYWPENDGLKVAP